MDLCFFLLEPGQYRVNSVRATLEKRSKITKVASISATSEDASRSVFETELNGDIRKLPCGSLDVNTDLSEPLTIYTDDTSLLPDRRSAHAALNRSDITGKAVRDVPGRLTTTVTVTIHYDIKYIVRNSGKGWIFGDGLVTVCLQEDER